MRWQIDEKAQGAQLALGKQEWGGHRLLPSFTDYEASLNLSVAKKLASPSPAPPRSHVSICAVRPVQMSPSGDSFPASPADPSSPGAACGHVLLGQNSPISRECSTQPCVRSVFAG